jgi:hypothetical protein
VLHQPLLVLITVGDTMMHREMLEKGQSKGIIMRGRVSFLLAIQMVLFTWCVYCDTGVAMEAIQCI